MRPANQPTGRLLLVPSRLTCLVRPCNASSWLPKKTFTFHISDEMKAALQDVRRKEGISEAEQIRRGIEMWLASKGRPKKVDRARGGTRKRS